MLIEPAVKLPAGRGASVQFGHELRAFGMSGDRVSELDFVGGDKIALGADDAVVLAVPPRAACSLLPGLKAPTKFRAIVNAHFRVDPPRDAAPILGVVGGLVEWLFAFPQRLSVTISNGDRLVDMPREELAQAIWRDICKASGVSGELATVADRARAPRATFEATPEQNAPAPGARDTGQKNLFLAGDWTATGLPATIEGSVRSRRSRRRSGSRPGAGRIGYLRLRLEKRRKAAGKRKFADSDVLEAAAAFDRRPAMRISSEMLSGKSRSVAVDPVALENEHLLRRPRRCSAIVSPDGHWVFELEADCHHSGRVRPAASLSRRARRYRARSQDRQLSAPRAGRARRLAAGP